MQALKKRLILKRALLLVSTLFFASQPAMAESDQAMFLKAREMQQQNVDHSKHAPVNKALEFRGVFYGYVPCNDCDGIKTTLSLKQNNNYLLVTQPAKESSREFYEKGKYSWDDKTQLVTLTPRKGGTSTHRYHIEDEGTLIRLNEDGTKMMGDLADRYALRRSDTVKNREVHIH